VPRVAECLDRRGRGLRDNIAAMRALVIALIVALLPAAGCGGKRKVGSGQQPALPFPAARWVPATPTYVFATRSMRDAQAALTGVVDEAMLTQVLGVNLLSPEALASIGVDVDGGMAIFSAAIDPTLVLHLSSPAAMQQFIDRQRDKAQVTPELRVDWKIEADWLWVHLAFAPHGDTTDWYAASTQHGAATWSARWDAAQQLSAAAASLIGIVDLRALTAQLATRVPDFVMCARQFEGVRGVGLAIEAEGNRVGGKIAVDVGGGAQTIAGGTIAPPPGWTTASARAPLAAQWNLDLRTVATWVQPCMQGGPNLVATLDEFGVRTARGFVHSLDPEDKSGTGAVALDLTHGKYFSSLLGQIPMRTKFERNRAFGAYKGKHLSVPFVATVDYVLDDRVFMLAMGDGVLERAASGAPPPPAPVFALDIIPSGLPADVWEWLFTEAELPQPKLLVVRLQRWNDIHLGAHLDRDTLVIEAQGNRR
jgi:hypothetical protein